MFKWNFIWPFFLHLQGRFKKIKLTNSFQKWIHLYFLNKKLNLKFTFSKISIHFFQNLRILFCHTVYFFPLEKKEDKENLNIVEKFICFNQKREITEKTVKIKKMAKKNSFVSSNWIFIRFFTYLRIRTHITPHHFVDVNVDAKKRIQRKKGSAQKKSSRKNSIRECFRPRLFSLWLDQIPINKL